MMKMSEDKNADAIDKTTEKATVLDIQADGDAKAKIKAAEKKLTHN